VLGTGPERLETDADREAADIAAEATWEEDDVKEWHRLVGNSGCTGMGAAGKGETGPGEECQPV
jgi:hypothetical protein